MAKVDAEKLKARYDKARAEYLAHQKRERDKRRKQKVREDTERKIVAGELLLSLVESGEWPRDRFLARLDTTLTDNRRRALFELPPLDDASNPPSVSAITDA